jgi:hypothetical protein
MPYSEVLKSTYSYHVLRIVEGIPLSKKISRTRSCLDTPSHADPSLTYHISTLVIMEISVFVESAKICLAWFDQCLFNITFRWLNQIPRSVELLIQMVPRMTKMRHLQLRYYLSSNDSIIPLRSLTPAMLLYDYANHRLKLVQMTEARKYMIQLQVLLLVPHLNSSSLPHLLCYISLHYSLGYWWIGAEINSMEVYKAVYDRSIKDPDGFWSEMANKYVNWFSPFTQVRHGYAHRSQYSHMPSSLSISHH